MLHVFGLICVAIVALIGGSIYALIKARSDMRTEEAIDAKIDARIDAKLEEWEGNDDLDRRIDERIRLQLSK
jgi:hypothetical protein